MILLISSTVSCAKTQQPQEDSKIPSEKTIQIGMTFDSFVIERWLRDRDIFVSAAKELGASVNVQNAGGDSKEQIRQIEYFIEKKMDVIVIIAVDSYHLNDVVQKAKRNGIKVIAYDRFINHAGVDLYISFDNQMVGRMMGETLIEAVPGDGKIAMIQGSSTDYNVSMVYDGFMGAVENSEVEIVASTNAEGWRAEEAFQFLNDIDNLNEIKGVMCGNDGLAGQAIRFLSMQRLAGDVTVVGQDAELEACQRIVEGTQTMTVYKPIEELATKAAECAVALANEETLSEAETILDGTNLVPYVKVMPVKVTKENMDEVIINGGFHLRDEVYLNVDSLE